MTLGDIAICLASPLKNRFSQMLVICYNLFRFILAFFEQAECLNQGYVLLQNNLE